MVLDTTDVMTIALKLTLLILSRITSTAKSEPAIGALNIAAVPPPTPQAIRVWIRFSDSRKN